MSTRTRTRTLTQGEIGLGQFHRLIGYASFAAGMCLMLASVTALYWFAGVIGLHPIARVAVALAVEVLAASLASSATTAYREGGKVDVSAWIGFAFFITIAAYANIMHVIVYIDVDQAPVWFPQKTFIIAACIFAAACPLGGTWGVHRFGWLRAHGADAQWQHTEDGTLVAQEPPARAARATTTAARPAPARRAPQQVSAPSAPRAQLDARATARAEVEAPRASVTDAPARAEGAPRAATSSDLKARARAQFEEMLALDPTTKPDAKKIHQAIESPQSEQNTRKWVKGWWDEYQQETVEREIAAVASPPAEHPRLTA